MLFCVVSKPIVFLFHCKSATTVPRASASDGSQLSKPKSTAPMALPMAGVSVFPLSFQQNLISYVTTAGAAMQLIAAVSVQVDQLTLRLVDRQFLSVVALVFDSVADFLEVFDTKFTTIKGREFLTWHVLLVAYSSIVAVRLTRALARAGADQLSGGAPLARATYRLYSTLHRCPATSAIGAASLATSVVTRPLHWPPFANREANGNCLYFLNVFWGYLMIFVSCENQLTAGQPVIVDVFPTMNQNLCTLLQAFTPACPTWRLAPISNQPSKKIVSAVHATSWGSILPEIFSALVPSRGKWMHAVPALRVLVDMLPSALCLSWLPSGSMPATMTVGDAAAEAAQEAVRQRWAAALTTYVGRSSEIRVDVFSWHVLLI